MGEIITLISIRSPPPFPPLAGKTHAMRNQHSFSFNSAHMSKTNKIKKARTEKMNRGQNITDAKNPGVGHLIPLAEFAKRLVDHHRFTVTFIFPGESSPSSSQRSILNSLPSSITSVYVHPVDLSDLPSTAGIETRISLTVTRSNPALRELSRRFSSSIYLAPMRSTWPMSSTDLTEPIKIPGCVPITGKDLSEPCQVRSDDTYKWLLHNAKRFREAEGILLNSFVDLKPNAIKALQEPAPDKPPVGPLVNTGSSYANGKDECECLNWLDNQPLGSVLYVSFGSGGTLTSESGKQFIWVIRSPSRIANSSFFNSHSQTDPLPPGFLDPTKGKGLVVPSWAPQVQLLKAS
ncbi:hypothetical protein YC2023_058522 [Brassica napus]